MQLKNIAVKNFRLLHDAGLLLEKQTTVIVGRNNSGKTSLTEMIKRLLGDSNPSFRLEDFSFATHPNFWNAFVAAAQGADEPDVRKTLPIIEIQLTFGYEVGEALGTLNEIVIDLDPACTEALVVARYALRDGKLGELFADLKAPDEEATPDQIELEKVALFKALRDRVPALFGIGFVARDPNDATNEKIIEASTVRTPAASLAHNAALMMSARRTVSSSGRCLKTCSPPPRRMRLTLRVTVRPKNLNRLSKTFRTRSAQIST